jgi:hypothetical protein
MTDEQAEELLRNNDWAKFSDARELLKTAARMGTAAQRKQPLTDKQVQAAFTAVNLRGDRRIHWWLQFARVIEAAHGITVAPPSTDKK